MSGIEPTNGHWSNGDPIDIAGVPLVREGPWHTPLIIAPYEAQNGGSFTATYRLAEVSADGVGTYFLCDVQEVMPPRPTQIQGYDDTRRAPMMDEYGYSAVLEAEQRRREWADLLAGATTHAD